MAENKTNRKKAGGRACHFVCTCGSNTNLKKIQIKIRQNGANHGSDATCPRHYTFDAWKPFLGVYVNRLPVSSGLYTPIFRRRFKLPIRILRQNVGKKWYFLLFLGISRQNVVLLTFAGYLGEIESDPQNVLDLRVYYCARRGCNLCVLRGGRVQNVWNMWQKQS